MLVLSPWIHAIPAPRTQPTVVRHTTRNPWTSKTPWVRDDSDNRNGL